MILIINYNQSLSSLVASSGTASLLSSLSESVNRLILRVCFLSRSFSLAACSLASFFAAIYSFFFSSSIFSSFSNVEVVLDVSHRNLMKDSHILSTSGSPSHTSIFAAVFSLDLIIGPSTGSLNSAAWPLYDLGF